MKYTINYEDQDIESYLESMIKERVYQHVKHHHPDMLMQIKKEVKDSLINHEVNNK